MDKIINRLPVLARDGFLLIYDDSISILGIDDFYKSFKPLKNLLKEEKIEMVFLNQYLSHHDNHHDVIKDLIKDLLNKKLDVILVSSIMLNGAVRSKKLFEEFKGEKIIFVEASCVFSDFEELEKNYFKINKNNKNLKKIIINKKN